MYIMECNTDVILKRVYDLEDRIKKLSKTHPEYNSLITELNNIQYLIEKLDIECTKKR